MEEGKWRKRIVWKKKSGEGRWERRGAANVIVRTERLGNGDIRR